MHLGNQSRASLGRGFPLISVEAEDRAATGALRIWLPRSGSLSHSGLGRMESYQANDVSGKERLCPDHRRLLGSGTARGIAHK